MRAWILAFLLPLGLFAAEPDTLGVEKMAAVSDEQFLKDRYRDFGVISSERPNEVPEILARLQKIKLPLAQAMMHILRADRYSSLELSSSARRELEMARRIVPEDSISLMIQLYNLLSVHMMYVSDYKKCILYNDSALMLAKAHSPGTQLETILVNRLPVIYLFNKNVEITRKEFLKISGQLTSLDAKLRLWLVFSNVLGASDQVDSALNWTSKAYEYLEAPEVNASTKIKILQQHARVLQHLGRIDESLQLLYRCDELTNTMGLPTSSSTQLEIIQILHKQGHSDSALALLDELHEEMIKDRNVESLMAIYTVRHTIYSAIGDFEKALIAYREYYSLKDSIFNARTVEQIAEIQAAYELKEKEAQLVKLEQEQKTQQTRLLWYATLFIALVLALGFGWRLQVIRSRQRMVEKERDQAMLSLKLQDQEMEKELLQEQIDHKSRQLTAQALHMARRQKMLEDVQEQLKHLSKEGMNAANLRQLSNKLVIEQRDEGEWELFQKGFEEVHPNFYSKLRARFPDVSTKEERLLALILLGLDGKECARILHIAPGSVKMARHRLRKKLGLPEGQDLEEFVRSL